MSVEIDRDSPPGSWRAARGPDTTCAACRQTECAHPDPVYQGLVQLRLPRAPLPHLADQPATIDGPRKGGGS